MTNNVPLNKNPLLQFQSWYQDAVETGMKYPDAMTLATSSPQGHPSARIVLYKGMNAEGLTFFTNYKSRKGKELLANPRAAVLFYWPQLNRQVRIEGCIQILSPSESDEYWQTRPRDSQISAMASPQSSKITGREILIKKINELNKKYRTLSPSTSKSAMSAMSTPNKACLEIPRPKHWGGYCLLPDHFEFWIEGKFRLHDRFQYLKKKGKWQSSRLAP
jgi:pyridoxamine-phosphate oxidase